MRPGFGSFTQLTDDRLAFIKQLGDGLWKERGRAFTIGYIKGIMAA